MGARRLQPARANVIIASARWVNVACWHFSDLPILPAKVGYER